MTRIGYDFACDPTLPRDVRGAAQHIERQARDAYRLFRQNPSHPGLHFKQVCADPLLNSARVRISYRAVCVPDGDTVVWF